MFFSTGLKLARLPPSVYWCMDLFYLRCKPLHYSGILLLWLYYYWAVKSPVWIPGIWCSFLTGSHWTVGVLWAQPCSLLSACLAVLPACGSSASRNLTSISAGYTHRSPFFHLASHLIIEGNLVKHDLPLIPVLAFPNYLLVLCVFGNGFWNNEHHNLQGFRWEGPPYSPYFLKDRCKTPIF